MQEETKDQVPATPVEAPTGPKTITKDKPVQSETTSEQKVTEPKLYKLPDGREVTADEVHKEYTENLLPEFTRKSQRLAELEKANAEKEARNKQRAEDSVSQSDLLKDVDPAVRDAIKEIVTPVIQEAIGQRDRAEEAKRANEQFAKRMDSLSEKYGKKFDKLEILREMQKPGQEIFDPEVLYQKLHWDDYLDQQVKAAMKGKAGDGLTESTSTQEPTKPGEQKEPSTWSEASKRAQSRL